ncbi:MAG: ATP-binding protein, partial [Candidatus Schekmanbacteria bacterium]|nr:ATP-binding protein [Candidatus Schekmanbacteria bacterium]
MPMKTLFELCEPRDDVLSGSIKESDYAADLAQVLRPGSAPLEYADPATFFANTHPTQGLRAVLRNVALRLRGLGGEAASIFRLDTQYGGGKTHALIALSHLAKGMAGVANAAEFLDPTIIPRAGARLAAWDGENADPLNGRRLGDDVCAYTPWGELAYALAGAAGYRSVAASDQQRVAPGAETLRDLFGGQPTLILLDELSVYLRKVRGRAEGDQLTPFLTGLCKAVESSPGAALVFTLAIGKTCKATDAYSSENEFIARKFEEIESVAARKATVLDPTSEPETAQVLRRRLFKAIDDAAAALVVGEYGRLWNQHAADLPAPRIDEDPVANFRRDYPFHPALMSMLTNKLSTLSNFQRVRGMLRLLTRTVARLWHDRPGGTYAVHTHQIDPGYGPIHNEIVTRLELSAFDPAIRNDVSASGSGASLAKQIDVKHYIGLAPYASFVARNILWHTFAFNEQIRGVTAPELRHAILGPGLDLSFINDARKRFMAESAFLDDRPAVPLRFLTEANLTQIIRRQENQIDPN